MASLPWLDGCSGFKADATDGQAWDLDQTRSHNKANEIDNDNGHGAAHEGAVTESAGPEWAGPRSSGDTHQWR
jgi:hypothetical protein